MADEKQTGAEQAPVSRIQKVAEPTVEKSLASLLASDADAMLTNAGGAGVVAAAGYALGRLHGSKHKDDGGGNDQPPTRGQENSSE
jgi:hypothetical protein